MIRYSNRQDLDGVMSILQRVGTAAKDPQQGFLMNDYTANTELHRQRYGKKLAELKYSYVYLEDEEIKAFLMAYTKAEWLTEVPGWDVETIWAPNFDRALLNDYVIINQTAMMPGLTGQGIGSKLYAALFPELIRAGYTHIFAETIISPYPNLASLNFRIKHSYQLAGIRFEEMNGDSYTTLVYYKKIK